VLALWPLLVWRIRSPCNLIRVVATAHAYFREDRVLMVTISGLLPVICEQTTLYMYGLVWFGSCTWKAMRRGLYSCEPKVELSATQALAMSAGRSSAPLL